MEILNHKINNNDRPRSGFLSTLPKDGIIAEIGVKTGSHALEMLRICNPKQMYLVDSWDDNDEYFRKEHGAKTKELMSSKKEEWFKHYMTTVNKFKCYKNTEIIKKKSYDASLIFEDNFFDAVYLDAGHRREFLMIDLKCWYPKIKVGGILCGHDFKLKGVLDFKNEKDIINNYHGGVSDVIVEFFSDLDSNIDLNLYLESSREGVNINSYEWMVEKK